MKKDLRLTLIVFSLSLRNNILEPFGISVNGHDIDIDKYHQDTFDITKKDNSPGFYTATDIITAIKDEIIEKNKRNIDMVYNPILNKYETSTTPLQIVLKITSSYGMFSVSFVSFRVSMKDYWIFFILFCKRL